MDFMFLAYSLPSLMQRFQISKVEAGSLASYTLLGMAVGVDWRLGGLSLRPRSRGGVDDHGVFVRHRGGPVATLNPDVAARVTVDG